MVYLECFLGLPLSRSGTFWDRTFSSPSRIPVRVREIPLNRDDHSRCCSCPLGCRQSRLDYQLQTLMSRTPEPRRNLLHWSKGVTTMTSPLNSTALRVSMDNRRFETGNPGNETVTIDFGQAAALLVKNEPALEAFLGALSGSLTETFGNTDPLARAIETIYGIKTPPWTPPAKQPQPHDKDDGY